MPRLTNNDYLIRHYWLQDIYQSHPEIFGTLPPKLQQAIHNYYQTAALLPEDELIALRVHIQQGNLSLPQVASKAFRRLQVNSQIAKKRSRGNPKTYRKVVSYLTPNHGTSRVTVTGRLKPQMDIDKLALILAEIVDKMSPAEIDRLAKEGAELIRKSE